LLKQKKRDGDVYEAMRDCYTALNLDKMHLKSHFRLAKCLNDLKWFKEAKECIDIFSRRFPDYAKSQACENLVKEINNGLKKMKINESKTDGQRSQNDDSSNRQKRTKLEKDDEEMSSDENSATADQDFHHCTCSSGDSNGDSGDEEIEEKVENEGEIATATTSSSFLNDNFHKKLLNEYNFKKENPVDFKKRYCGHCNVATDIKEANYLGE
jgi:hypothetical protein